MSEFTAGNLFSKKHYKTLLNYSPKHIKEINAQWSVLFTDATDVSDRYPRDILELSEEVPILYFYNFEDHGWGFTIVYGGSELSKFDFSYEQEEIDLQNYVQEKFPNEDVIELLYINPNSGEFREGMLQELYQDRNREEEIKALFANLNIEAFNLFEIEHNQIVLLEKLFSVRHVMTLDRKHRLVEEFKTILNIREMSWIRSDRLED